MTNQSKRGRDALVKLTVAAGLLALPACGSFIKSGRIQQYASPTIDATRFKTVTVIADSENKFDMQIMGRVREQMTEAGVRLVKRTGRWESEKHMLDDVCTQQSNSPDNVDGIVVARWDRITLHDCGSKAIALDVTGGYAGTDAMTERLLRYLGAVASK